MIVGAVFAAIILLVVLMFRVVDRGVTCAARGRRGVPAHRRAATQALLATAFLILAVEVFVQLSGGRMTDPRLFVAHMSAAIPFLVLMLVLRFWVNGLRYPRVHKLLAGLALACFVGVLATGVMMLCVATEIIS